MRHKKNTKKFKRTEEERRKLKIDLTRGLIKSGQIITFKTRAKWFIPFFERLVTQVKKAGDDQQLAFHRLRKYLDEDTSRVMIEKIVPKLKDRNGGYTRVLSYEEPFNVHQKAIVMIVE